MSVGEAEIPQGLRDAIRDRRLIPMIGPGVPLSVRDALGGPLIPSWTTLLERVADRLGSLRLREELRVRAYLEGDPPDYAQAMHHAAGGLGEDWAMFLSEELDPPQTLVQDDKLTIPRKLWSLGCPLLITTTIDRVLQWTCPEGIMPRRWVIEPPTRDREKLQAALTVPHLWHLFGHIDMVPDVVLTPDGNEPYFHSEDLEERFLSALDLIRELASTHSMLFVGFDLDNREGGGRVAWLRDIFAGLGGTHYFLARHKELDDLPHAIDGVTIEFLGYDSIDDDSTSSLANILGTLASYRPREPSGPLQAVPEVTTQEHSLDVVELSGSELLAGDDDDDDGTGQEPLADLIDFDVPRQRRSRFESVSDAVSWATSSVHLVAEDAEQKNAGKAGKSLPPPPPSIALDAKLPPPPPARDGFTSVDVTDLVEDTNKLEFAAEAAQAQAAEAAQAAQAAEVNTHAPANDTNDVTPGTDEDDHDDNDDSSDEPARPLSELIAEKDLTPRYDDDQTRALSEQLEAAIEQRMELRRRGQETADVEAQIKQLRSKLREGGHLKAGDSLGDGRYLLVRRVGQGGFATVWMANDRALEKSVAIKVLHAQYARDKTRRERFFRGARKMRDLDHDGIVRVIDLHGVEAGYHYFVMEYVDGYNLREAIRRQILPREQVLEVIKKVGDALAHAHSRGLVHRDVKPSNILVNAAGEPKLTDFDLVRADDTTGSSHTGSAMGSFIYGAPEVMDRAQEADAASDVYSLAMTAVYGLHGSDLSMAVVRDTGQYISQLPATTLIKEVLQRALDWDRKRRFQTAEGFCEALAQAQAGTYRRPEEPARKRKTLPGDENVLLHDDLDPEQTLEHLDSGTIIAGRFKVITCLGRSGLGTMYLGERINIGQRVAIKVLTDSWEWVRSNEGSQRFRNIALAASRTGQPNILEVFEAGSLPDNRLYMVMEYIEGFNLYAELQEHGRLPVRRACRIVRAVARAVRAAHDAGIIHRDLKPLNVMFVPLPDGSGEAVQVFDFGISAWAESEARLSDPSVFIATPEYMAPEQIRGKEPTPLLDIYALGVMLYEILVGEPPFVAATGREVMARKLHEKAPSLGSKRPELPHNLIVLVDDCLAIDPAERPPSARSFLERIGEAIHALASEKPTS